MPWPESSEPQTLDQDILDEVDRAIAALELHPDDEVRTRVRALLEGIDAVHRAGLTHLVRAIHAMAGEAFLNRLVADPAIRLLLMSYNLIAVDRRLQAEEALDLVRGHLHDHGVDVEILEVVGGVVYVRLHQSHRGAAAPPPLDAIRRDLEEALRAGLLGFQELVFRDRDPAPAAARFVPLNGLRTPNRPVYHDVSAADDVRPGELQPAMVHGVPVLLANVDGEIYAIRNRCGDSPLPLEFGTLSGVELRCSWHGCRYDVRSGRRLDGDPGRVQTFPVTVEAGRVRIALGVEPAVKAE